MRRIYSTKQNNQAGFTAVEIAMVASVIAILALLILPLFRQRSDEAKLVGAKDELHSLVKALLLAEADTGKLFRLQDLDNGITAVGPTSTIRPDMDVPISQLNATLLQSERAKLIPPSMSPSNLLGSSYWRGPYISFQKSATVGFLKQTTSAGGRPYLFLSYTSSPGPIYDIVSSLNNGYVSTDYGTIFDSDSDRIPVDPWGSPYIFINETTYGLRAIYSLGPDGLPGDAPASDWYSGSSYQPVQFNGYLGRGDDLEFIF